MMLGHRLRFRQGQAPHIRRCLLIAERMFIDHGGDDLEGNATGGKQVAPAW
jgi:hypothetical protein